MSKTIVEMNRETWLTEVASKLVPIITPHAKATYGEDWQMPNYRVAMGFPSKRALSTKKRRIGECWVGRASADGAFEILISPLTISDVPEQERAMKVTGVVAHELVHAADRCVNGHQKAWLQVARRIGLTGKPTATTEGPLFIETVTPLLVQMPEMPIVPLAAHGVLKKQPTLMLKCQCSKCGYILRTTEKWLLKGIPQCPVCGIFMDNPIRNI